MEATAGGLNDSLKSVGARQNEVEDIEDLLAVLEGVVGELKDNPGEMDMQCLMYKYAHLETSVLESLEQNTQGAASDSHKQRLLNGFIERYTAAGPDFQGKWDEKHWHAYGVATRGHRVSLEARDGVSLRDLGEKLNLLQGLANTLTHLSASPGSQKTTSTGATQTAREPLRPVVEAAVKAHRRQLALPFKSGSGDGCCTRCGIF